jgi:hypothetical protein
MKYSPSYEMCFHVPLIEGVGGGKNMRVSKQILFGYKGKFITIQIREDESIPPPYPPPAGDIRVLAHTLFINRI